MKSFFKSLIVTIIGSFVSIVLVFILFIVLVVGSIGAIGSMASREQVVDVKDNSILYLTIDKPIIDRQPYSPFDFKRFRKDERLGLNKILNSIRKAKDDEKIKGIYIELSMQSIGYATMDEIREALVDFKSSGKFVVSYSDIYSQSAYYLATASDKIFFSPSGFFILNGIRVQTMHLKKTMEKLNIEPTVVKIGKYKGAGEIFEYNKMSSSNREQLERLVNTVWANISEDISKSRNINIDSLNYIVGNLLIKNPEDALKLNFVDSLIYKGQVIDYLKKLTDTPESKDLNSVKLSSYSKAIEFKGKKAAKNKIAVVYASGEIITGEGEEGNVGGDKFSRELRKIRKDTNIKAVVLRVNSPGGSAMASDEMLVELKKLKESKPVVVSMGDVAASGGYYISCAADTIISGRNTITGSIGVISVLFNTKGFFDKLGVNFDVAKTHKYSDFMSGNRSLSNEELAFWEQFTEYTYNQFLTHVSEGRGMEYDTVNELARGRVWSGDDALDKGLVDLHGGLNFAIKVAGEMAGLDEKYKVVELPKPADPIEELLKQFTGQSKVNAALEPFGVDKYTIQQIKTMLGNQGTLARLPYYYEMK